LAAITGSSGKTTTTTLVGKMLEASGYTVHVGGNIGAPLIDRLDASRPASRIVLELSSFQLELFDPALAWGELDGIGPDVAAILNITPNHLDRHPDMAAYAAAKFNLLRCTACRRRLIVLSADDAVTAVGLLAQWRGAVRQAVPEQWAIDLLAGRSAAPRAWRLACVLFIQPRRMPGGRLARGRPAGLWRAADLQSQRSQAARRAQYQQLLAADAISGAASAPRRRAWQRWRAPLAACRTAWRSWPRPAASMWVNDSIATSPERASPVAQLRPRTA
jgi:UDP-N-acetylmuramoylalanine--D-glutamate ligase